ncbi:hypothetical protein [Sulfitobacter aestuariivivens]|uniref:Uncharacterized protein n=1 Tax=Sulfitobacter aestuariivivens TaxID=2766981 RepID=A0A927D207_9RHOB|nr:hypothetical protein [Sulfitobacter aestuariivivens]MBD3663645.1 hypothetical protein [Sulfitobacter aestuariivivens]
MTPLVAGLVVVLIAWMVLCILCGYRRRLVLFLGVLVTGLTLNQVWMYLGLQAKPTELNAVVAQLAVVFYGLSAFGAGWFVSRVTRAWVESRVGD